MHTLHACAGSRFAVTAATPFVLRLFALSAGLSSLRSHFADIRPDSSITLQTVLHLDEPLTALSLTPCGRYLLATFDHAPLRIYEVQQAVGSFPLDSLAPDRCI